MPGIRGPGRRRPCWPRPRPGPPVTGAQLASYAGLAPATRRSGSSIRGEHVSHAGNKRLKHAMLPSAVASLRSAPVSRAYYQRKPGQGKRLGPSRPRPGPPPHPDPARHDPQRHPLRPTTSHETTHRHLTHHIGAPVDWLVGFGGASFINRRCAIVLTRVTSVSGRLGWAKVLDDVDSGARNPLRFCKSCGSFLCQISIVRVV